MEASGSLGISKSTHEHLKSRVPSRKLQNPLGNPKPVSNSSSGPIGFLFVDVSKSIGDSCNAPRKAHPSAQSLDNIVSNFVDKIEGCNSLTGYLRPATKSEARNVGWCSKKLACWVDVSKAVGGGDARMLLGAYGTLGAVEEVFSFILFGFRFWRVANGI